MTVETASTQLSAETQAWPGIDYSAFTIDPDGHAIELYHSMQEVGPNGQPWQASSQADGAASIETWPQRIRGRAGQVVVGMGDERGAMGKAAGGFLDLAIKESASRAGQ